MFKRFINWLFGHSNFQTPEPRAEDNLPLIEKSGDIMPESEWYSSEAGRKAADKAFGPVEYKKK